MTLMSEETWKTGNKSFKILIKNQKQKSGKWLGNLCPYQEILAYFRIHRQISIAKERVPDWECFFFF